MSGSKKQKYISLGQRTEFHPTKKATSKEYYQLFKYIHNSYPSLNQDGAYCIYFPTYVFLKIKNITFFDINSLTVKINAVLNISINLKLPQFLQDTQDNNQDMLATKKFNQSAKLDSKTSIQDSNYKQTKQNIQQKIKNIFSSQKCQKENQKNLKQNKNEYLFIRFNRDNPIKLPSKQIVEGYIKYEQPDQNQIMNCTIIKQLTLSLQPNQTYQDFLAPFCLFRFKLQIQFQDIITDQGIFKFNCMIRHGNKFDQKSKIFQQVKFTDDSALGDYDLAEAEIDVIASKQKFNQNSHVESQSYKVISFIIPFYKHPFIDILQVYLPLVLITILTLFTFAQAPDFNDKIGNIATLMIVYVGVSSVVNDSLPSIVTSVTLMDIVIYLLISVDILCLIRGYTIRKKNADQFNKFKVFADPTFLIAISVSSLCGVILISFIARYFIYKKYYYNMQQSEIIQAGNNKKKWVSSHLWKHARKLKKDNQQKQSKQQKQQKNKKQNKQSQKKGQQELLNLSQTSIFKKQI